MELKLCNIGKIIEAEFKFDGITVLAGNNNTGKSTVGKVLYAILENMGSWPMEYSSMREKNIKSILLEAAYALESFCLEHTEAKRKRTARAEALVSSYASEQNFIASIEDAQLQLADNKIGNMQDSLAEILQHFARDYIALYAQAKISEVMQRHTSFIKNWVEKTETKLCKEARLDEQEYQEQMLKNSLDRWLYRQVLRLGADKGTMGLKTGKGDKYILNISEGRVKLNKAIRMNRHIHYVASPFLYDEVNAMRGQVTQERICGIMTPEPLTERIPHKFSPTTVRMAQDYSTGDVKNVLQLMQKAMNGRAEAISKEGFKFRDNDVAAYINAGNVSTGVKAMAFLEYALRIGAITKSDILVFDEPEINLHPEWQIIYARVLVMLQKKMDLRIIITTHSPYFIRALECLSYTNEIMDKLNIYLFEQDGDHKLRIRNMSEQEEGLPKLYEQLSHPLDELDSEINKFVM